MNKTLKIINILLIISIIIGDIFFILACQNIVNINNLIIKSLTSILFVGLGIVNFVLAKKQNSLNKKFATLMLIGLTFAMLGDILLEIVFIVGAVLFAIGHIFYFAAYTSILPINRKDFSISACIFIPALLILLFVPLFNFGGILMQIVCIIYALIISLMVGKSISNLTQNKSIFNIMLVIGSCLFFFSDFMLLFDVFANLSNIFEILCLATYYPAEILLAISLSKS